MPICQWQNVITDDNSADALIKGIMPSSLHTHKIWWSGPLLLSLDESKWPKSCETVSEDKTTEKRTKRKAGLVTLKIEKSHRKIFQLFSFNKNHCANETFLILYS